MKHTRTTLSIVCSLSLLLLTPMLQAADTGVINEKDRQRHEATGVVGGAVVGGILGGPLGAIVTAVFGGVVSDQAYSRKENKLLAAELESQQQALLAMQADYRALQASHQVALRNAEASRVRAVSLSQGARLQNQTVTTCCKDTELSLHFKTASSSVEPFYNDKLVEFAAVVKEFPGTVIEITGHADRRGDSGTNLALSQQRVQAVERKLASLGVRNVSLKTNAFGESKPATADDSLENNFFDRRVIVKLLGTGNGLLTQTDD